MLLLRNVNWFFDVSGVEGFVKKFDQLFCAKAYNTYAATHQTLLYHFYSLLKLHVAFFEA